MTYTELENIWRKGSGQKKQESSLWKSAVCQKSSISNKTTFETKLLTRQRCLSKKENIISSGFFITDHIPRYIDDGNQPGVRVSLFRTFRWKILHLSPGGFLTSSLLPSTWTFCISAVCLAQLNKTLSLLTFGNSKWPSERALSCHINKFSKILHLARLPIPCFFATSSVYTF